MLLFIVDARGSSWPVLIIFMWECGIFIWSCSQTLSNKILSKADAKDPLGLVLMALSLFFPFPHLWLKLESILYMYVCYSAWVG